MTSIFDFIAKVLQIAFEIDTNFIKTAIFNLWKT